MRRANLVVAVAAVLGCAVVNAEDGGCVWYDECGKDPSDGRTLNCRYEGQPVSLDEPGLQLLYSVCPHYSETSTKTACCSAKQLTSIKSSFGLLNSILGRCPSCFYNFRKLFCDLACNPGHSQFLSNIRTIPGVSASGGNVSMVKELDFHIREDFVSTAFEACRDVTSPLTGGNVLDIFCGSWGALCSPHRLFAYLGSLSNGNSPIQINFRFEGADNASAYGPAAFGCAAVAPNETQPCSCTDCQDACAAGQSLADDEDEDAEDTDQEVTIIVVSVVFAVLAIAINVGMSVGKRMRCKPEKAAQKHSRPWYNWTWKRIETAHTIVFRRIGTWCSMHPAITLSATLAAVIVCACGITFSQILTDPLELWSAPTSRSRMEREAFNQAFRPFFRVQQIIVRSTEDAPFEYTDLLDERHNMSTLLSKKFLLATLQLQKAVEAVTSSEGGVRLEEVCHMPLAPDVRVCNVQSVWSYWQDDEAHLHAQAFNNATGHLDTYLDHFLVCARNPAQLNTPTKMGQSCFSRGGLPVQPYFVLGGVDAENLEPSNASALVMTFLLNNFNAGSPELEKALRWEKAFVTFMRNWTETQKPDFMDVAFNSERSVEDELKRSSVGDISPIIASYSAMLVYVLLTLGNVTSWRRVTVELPISLSLAGIGLVLVAIVAAIGIFGYIGVSTTLIIFKILPYLVLAVGVDNLYILSKSLEASPRRDGESAHEHVGRVVGDVAPAMFHSMCTQVIAFLFGGMSDMPAVRAFALYAALSLALNFAMQVTAFVAVMSLDHRRKSSNRNDVLCCFVSGAERPGDEPGFIQRGFNEYYVPALMSRLGRRVVIVAFLGWTAFSVCRISQINIGLEQEVALPDDSYVLKYLVSLKKYLSVGPPVYFVVNVTDPTFDLSNESAQNLLCGGHGCSHSSLQAHIKQWSRESNVTQIAAPAQSWIDDYFDWFRHCCKSKRDSGEYCAPGNDSAKTTDVKAASDYGDYGDYGDFKEEVAKAPEEECLPCDRSTKGRPSGDAFWRFLPAFLSENPSKTCPKGGRAAYADAVRVASDNRSVSASSFFTFHTVLRNSDDYVEAMRWSRRLSRIAEDALGGRAHVYAYSIFYVFYEQYLDIVTNTVQSLVISTVAVFITVFILNALNLTAALITVLIIVLIQVNLLGMMQWGGISLNAISLVNLVMTIGISVEFCSHLTKAYSVCSGPSRVARAEATFKQWGLLLLSGVHMTHLIGVVILGFAKSQIFSLYYFRMYVGIVLIGAVHGLVLLPVLLSFYGPDGTETIADTDKKLPAGDDVADEATSASETSNATQMSRQNSQDSRL